MLRARIAPPAELPPAGLRNFTADVTLLVCERECIPGEASLALGLPVARGGTAPVDPAGAPVFAAARKDVPRPSPPGGKRAALPIPAKE